MPMYTDTSCLYSTVKNTSGKAMIFGFLPPHGKKLANNESFTVFGDIREAVARSPERASCRRSMIAFENCIESGDLTIIKTPAPILQDETTEATKQLRLNNGSLGVIDPCWARSVSDDLIPV